MPLPCGCVTIDRVRTIVPLPHVRVVKMHNGSYWVVMHADHASNGPTTQSTFGVGCGVGRCVGVGDGVGRSVVVVMTGVGDGVGRSVVVVMTGVGDGVGRCVVVVVVVMTGVGDGVGRCVVVVVVAMTGVGDGVGRCVVVVVAVTVVHEIVNDPVAVCVGSTVPRRILSVSPLSTWNVDCSRKLDAHAPKSSQSELPDSVDNVGTAPSGQER